MSAQPYKISTAEGFLCGGLAACTAVTVSNPAEVAKTRLQLDGELQQTSKVRVTPAASSAGPGAAAAAPSGVPPAAAEYKKVYNSAFDALRKTWQYEGISGVQRGLSAAYAYQIMLNGSRLGFYEPIRHITNRTFGLQEDKQVMTINVFSGAASGVIGAMAGNPLFLVKARMQAYSKFNPVGAQHYYSSPWAALASIGRQEGIKGLFRGLDAAMLRTAAGSSVQLPAYNFAKRTLVGNEWLPDKSVWTYLAASTFSGCCVCLVMQPPDTALTRLYNQSPNAIGPDGKPRGLLYKNPIDCLVKTFKAEGIRGLYKGTTAHLLRIAPHTVVTLVANEFIVAHYIKLRTGEGI